MKIIIQFYFNRNSVLNKMDEQENNDNTHEVDLDVEIFDDNDDSWPVFSNMQQWAYASISVLEIYGIFRFLNIFQNIFQCKNRFAEFGDLYETMANFVALIIILFHATNTIVQDENQIHLDKNSDDEVPEEKKTAKD